MDQNGPKIDQKWTKNKPKMDQSGRKWTKIDKIDAIFTTDKGLKCPIMDQIDQ